VDARQAAARDFLAFRVRRLGPGVGAGLAIRGGMLRRFSIAELQSTGVTIQPFEAVAIAQQLIRVTCSANADAKPPFGPPTAANVFLTEDGSVACGSCAATCAVSEIAIFLDALLPPGTARVAGSLRYAVARALHDVDAPPFDSLDDFSRALARHEHGAPTDVISAIVARASAPVERRRTDRAVADLRRQLRESDARVYDQQQALDALTAMTPSAPRAPRRFALAAGLFVGVTLVGAGEWMHIRPAADATVATSSVGERVEQPSQSATTVPAAARELAPAVAPPVETPVMKPAARTATPPAKERNRDRRSRFHWLRTRIAVRADPL
jgi:hypothetical protein